ncbi:glycerophosphocholine phosphodiesterase GPCPD1-like [Physella acuta]|uniref:glycerophosphocholine phosphodiesterase GPCPD1-like n=1 Tax=Physella acuta TaxID=109671 RepID=UPI0027DD8944|nr:glycerophosphocholine phosphodiesterase GPCPD1-like [Physella acuta]
MSSAKRSTKRIQINFRIRINIPPRYYVYIVGNGTELGEWQSNFAKVMSQREASHIWQLTLLLKSPAVYRYRYFVGRPLRNINQTPIACVDEVNMDFVDSYWNSVCYWETTLPSRMLHTRNLPDVYDLPLVDLEKRLNPFQDWSVGWVQDASEIRLRIRCLDSIQMALQTKEEERLRVKCSPIDFQEMILPTVSPTKLGCKPEESDLYQRVISATKLSISVLANSPCGPGGFTLPDCANKTPIFATDAMVTKLSINPAPQPEPETARCQLQVDGYFSFNIFTMFPGALGFRMEFYVSEPVEDKMVGYSYILPVSTPKAVKQFPVFSPTTQQIGHVIVDWMLISPTPDLDHNMEVSYQNYWKTERRKSGQDTTEYGFGRSFLHKKIIRVKENTLASLYTAGEEKANFLHLAIQLTKDKVPVLFHAFKVMLAYHRRSHETEFYMAPVKDLEHTFLRALKISYHPKTRKFMEQGTDRDPLDLEPFPTLENCLEKIGQDIGFLIEVKHPQVTTSNQIELDDYFDHNTALDVILNTVFNLAAKRRIIFTSTDPDTCVMLQRKQNRYPVLFRLKLNKSGHPYYQDLRAGCVDTALQFAVAERFLGVYLSTYQVLKDLQVIDQAQKMGLVVFVYADGNFNIDLTNPLARHKVDGLCTKMLGFTEVKDKHEPVFHLSESRSNSEKVTKVILEGGFQPSAMKTADRLCYMMKP